MANPPQTDPFLSVQSDVLATLTETRSLFSSFLRIRTLASSRGSSTTPELTQARTDLENNIALLDGDLGDLRESVAAVEGDPYRFGLDVAEVQRRRGFVGEVRGEVEGMRREIFGESGAAGAGGGRIDSADATARSSLPPPAAFARGQFDEDGEEGGDSYTAFEEQQQQTMMAEQDEQLDDVSRTVGVLRGQAVDMGRELEEQHGMLEDVDALADRVGGKLQVGVKKVGEVIRRNEDSVSSCCIAVLISVLIILLILVIVL
jgi:hypothetical protein